MSRITQSAEPAPVPYPRVVAGIDFSPASLAGCRWALEHVARGADVLFSHVVPVEQGPRLAPGDAPSLPTGEGSPREALALRKGLGGFAATLAVARARTAVRTGSPSAWLGRLAEEVDASLVIVGRRSDANRKRIGEPNVIARLARRARAAVLVVPEGVTEAPRCIVAAIDEGPSGVEVLRSAALLAASLGLTLIALHVMQPVAGAYDRVVHPKGRRSVAASAQVATVPPRGRLTFAVGDPAREIVAAGIAHGGGLLVIGKRGADDSPAGSLGSVARELLAKSPLAVLAIETGQRAAG